MSCCGKKNYSGSNFNNNSVPQSLDGTNQKLIKQIQDQQRQQAEIQRVIQQSNNPTKSLIKTYR